MKTQRHVASSFPPHVNTLGTKLRTSPWFENICSLGFYEPRVCATEDLNLSLSLLFGSNCSASFSFRFVSFFGQSDAANLFI